MEQVPPMGTSGGISVSHRIPSSNGAHNLYRIQTGSTQYYKMTPEREEASALGQVDAERNGLNLQKMRITLRHWLSLSQ